MSSILGARAFEGKQHRRVWSSCAWARLSQRRYRQPLIRIVRNLNLLNASYLLIASSITLSRMRRIMRELVRGTSGGCTLVSIMYKE
jgi:hypothetical protein